MAQDAVVVVSRNGILQTVDYYPELWYNLMRVWKTAVHMILGQYSLQEAYNEKDK